MTTIQKKDVKKIPQHIAIIPDGNRRWSKKNNYSLPHGYTHGANQVEKNMETAFQEGVKYFTVWAASNDNLKKRNIAEIKILEQLLKNKLRELISSPQIEKNHIRIRIVGTGVEQLKNKELLTLKKQIEKKTEKFSAHHFTLLFGYDGKTEMLSAIEKIKKTGEDVTYESVKKHLLTFDLPPVDLVIRTGGEPHWSAGFMMWHTCDSQFYFTETFWPGFGSQELKKAIHEFGTRRSLKGK